MRAPWVSVLAALTVLGGCAARSESSFLVVEGPPEADLPLERARVEGGARSVVLSSGKLVIEERAGAGNLTVHVAGACPLHVAASDLHPGDTARRRLVPWFDFGPERPDVGFGAEFRVTAVPGCADAAKTAVTWSQTEGEALRDLRVAEDGRALAATMPALPEASRSSRLAVLPFSPWTRGEVVLRATWSDPDGRTVERTVQASAAPRSRGLANVAVSGRLYLGGEAVALVSAPPGSHAAVETRGGVASFTPDVTGRFTLTAAHGPSLTLYAGRYDETPLDCGRSDCHAAIAASARSSPMTTILQRGLDGPFAGAYPSCAIGCHTLGDRGLDDGGFLAVATALGLSSSELRRTGFNDLPVALRRLGGVGCLACHGPGTVAEPHGRDALLRADVCATCHDAPPRYGHVVAWRSTRMARADADPRVRTDAACARCHTTWGFLGLGDHAPPDDAPPVGIACAACHAVHPAARERGTVIGATCAEALRRDAALPDVLAGAAPPRSERSRACFGCHAPGSDEAAPSASATAIWAGRGGLNPTTGAPLAAPSPHEGVEGGCIGCHRSGPGTGRGANHGFAARDDRVPNLPRSADGPVNPRAGARTLGPAAREPRASAAPRLAPRLRSAHA